MVTRALQVLGVRSPQIQQVAQGFSGLGLQARYIARDFVFVEDLPHLRQKAWHFPCKLRMLLGRLGEVQQLLAYQIIQRALRAEAPLDSLGRPALLDPDLLKSNAHSRPIIPPSKAALQYQPPWSESAPPIIPEG